jgi:PAS domain S-box-containing protein
MHDHHRETSCYSSSLIIKYAKQKHYNLSSLFNGIEDRRNILENRNEWIDIDTWVKLAKNFEAAGGDLFTAGRDITEHQVTDMQLLFIKVFSLSFIIKNYSKQFDKKISPLISLAVDVKDKGTFDVTLLPKVRSKYSKEICDFNRGCIYAVGIIKRLVNFKLAEVTCAARSDAPECRYRFSWTPDPPFLDRFKSFFYFRFHSQKAILGHMEENYNHLQDQYKELASIKNFYYHIMANMKEGIAWLTGDLKISFVNKGFLDIIRCSLDEGGLIGTDFRTFFATSTAVTLGNNLLARCRNAPQSPETLELLYRANDGAERLGQTTALWVESSQQEPGFLLSIRDITDKRDIERKLYAVENRYRSLYENSPAMIIGVDQNGTILYANPAMVEQSGYSEEELKRMHYAELVAPVGSNADVKDILDQRLGKVGLQEMHYRTKGGEWKTVALATFPLYDDEWKTLGLGGIGVDVTETKRLNEILIQTQRMELLGQMAGGLAHDFKNLLSVVSGYSRLIADMSNEQKIQDYASNIQIANDRAAGLVKNLLTFSSGETVRNEPFLINDVVEEVKKLLPPILGRTIRLFVEVEPKHYQIRGDSGKIHQCLLNLCINARDALCDREGGKVLMRLKDDAEAGWCFLEVEDNGPGIPPDIIGRIFDPFFSTKKKQEGTGLGLSVVYGVVKSHGGEIMVDSRPGEGVTFSIRLPLFTEGKATGNSAHSESGVNERIVLVVDSDGVARNFCAQILSRQGYRIVQFSTIAETAAWLDQNIGGQKIALFPAVQAQEAITLTAARNDLFPLWICEKGSLPPSPTQPQLQRPFPPAALIETVKTIERGIKR